MDIECVQSRLKIIQSVVMIIIMIISRIEEVSGGINTIMEVTLK